MWDQIFISSTVKKQAKISKELNKTAEAALQSCSKEKVFWKYAAPLPKCDFNKVCFATLLLKPHFGMGVLLQIWCIGQRDSGTGVFLWILRNF